MRYRYSDLCLIASCCVMLNDLFVYILLLHSMLLYFRQDTKNKYASFSHPSYERSHAACLGGTPCFCSAGIPTRTILYPNGGLLLITRVRAVVASLCNVVIHEDRNQRINNTRLPCPVLPSPRSRCSFPSGHARQCYIVCTCSYTSIYLSVATSWKGDR